jgi:Holliday junction resolvase
MSGATSRRKGNKAEQDVARVLREAGYDAVTSRSAQGFQAGADILSDFPACIEVKNQARLDLSGWWTQAQLQAQDAPAVVVHKRVGRGDPLDWWVTMDFRTLLRLVGER